MLKPCDSAVFYSQLAARESTDSCSAAAGWMWAALGRSSPLEPSEEPVGLGSSGTTAAFTGPSVSACDGAPDQTSPFKKVSDLLQCFFCHPVWNLCCYFRLNHNITLWLNCASSVFYSLYSLSN